MSDFLDTILPIVVIGAVAGVILGVLFGVIETWRYRTLDRRIRKHLRK